MKKEYFALIILILFSLSYVFDKIAGPVNIFLHWPWEFFMGDLPKRYPFTTVAISFKVLGILLSIILITLLIKKKYFTKALLILFIAIMAELYTIQQISTGVILIPIQWILAISFSAVLSLIPVLIFLLLGIINLVIDKTLTNKDNENYENHS